MMLEDRHLIAEALEKIGKPMLANDARQQVDVKVLSQYVRVIQHVANDWYILEPLWSAGLIYA